MNDFPIGTSVDVSADGDFIREDFCGTVVGYRGDYIQVRDAEDCVFDCDRAQLMIVE